MAILLNKNELRVLFVLIDIQGYITQRKNILIIKFALLFGFDK